MTLLKRLPADDHDAVVAAGQRRRVRAGEILFHEGDQAYEVLVILSGIIKVSTAAGSGRFVILDVLDAGEVLGELSAIDGRARSATASALVDSELLVVPATRFRALLEERPAIGLTMLQIVCERLRGASRRQLEFSTSDALGRLCGAIVDLADRFGESRNGVREVVLPLAQADLAAWGGLSREAIVKGLRSLRQLGWVAGEGRTLRLLDEDALRDRARD